ncbi:MAG TPA: glycosyltransferase family 4 protein [Geminicoccaceae bacterium]|nr:glycosyltransferase family 4 protein [Geminicoccaceae bacterium]
MHFVVPGPLDQRTGGYLYDRRIVEGLRAQGREVSVHELAGRFPLVDDAACAAAAAAIDALSDGLPVIDGLALPAFADLADRLPKRWVALVHHPLALESGLTAAQAETLARLEHRLLRAACCVIVTSAHTVADLAAYQVSQARIGVVPPGTHPAPLARGSGGPGLALLCVASLTPRKGHLVLLEALADLADLDWHLTCVGSRERDPQTAAAIEAAIVRLGLEARVALVGEQDDAGLAPLYDGADLFVLASYHEGYGMALAEALARGLPIVATKAGAIPGTVPPSAGMLAEPGDPCALAAALRQIMTEPSLRLLLAAGAASERERLPSWAGAVCGFAAQLDRVAG